MVQFFRDPPRAVPREPKAVLSPADGRIVAVERARDPYLERDALKISVFMNVFNVHSNRSPVDGEVRDAWYHRGSFFNAALAKASLENERNALWIAHRGRRGRDLRAGRRADRAAHPVLRQAGRAARARRALRLHPLRLARGRLPAAGVAAGRVRVGDKVYAAGSDARGAAVSCIGWHERASPQRTRELMHANGIALRAARHLLAAEPVHDRRAVRRLLRDRAGDERALRAGGDRDLRGDGARRPRRPGRAPDAHPERVRRRVRQPRPTWCRSAWRRRWWCTSGR